MNNQISRVWTFASDSNPNIEYQTLQYLDGSTSCNCKGWTRRVAAADGSRSCKHTRYVDMGIADQNCTATHNYETTTNEIERTQPMAKTTSSKSPSSDIASSPSDMGQKIINYIRAGYPGLYLVSHEEQRVAVEMTRIAQELKYNLVFWSVVDGLVDVEKGTNNSANDPLEALIAIQDLKEKTLILLRDFHLFLQDPNPILIRQLKDVLQMAKTKSKTLIILGCRMVLPPELERELTVIEFALPGKEELRAVLGGIMESANIKAHGSRRPRTR